MTIQDIVDRTRNIPKISVSDPSNGADEIVAAVIDQTILLFDNGTPVIKSPLHYQRLSYEEAEALVFNLLEKKARVTVPSKQIKESLKRLRNMPELQVDLTEKFWEKQMFVNLNHGVYSIMKLNRNEESFKSLISCEYTTGSEKFEKQRDFVATLSFIFAGNADIEFVYMDDAVLDRLVYIMFTKEIPEEEIDLDLEEKLLGEKNVIFSLALDSLKRLIEDKYDFKMAPIAEEHIKRRRYLIHSAESFITEKCTLSKDGKVSKVALYAAYLAFCKANALTPVGRNTFYNKVRNYSSSIIDGRAPDAAGNSVQGFHGISLIGGEHQQSTDDESDE